jgi:hypothetical protein
MKQIIILLIISVSCMATETNAINKIQKSLDSLNRISNTSDFQKGEKEGFARALAYVNKAKIKAAIQAKPVVRKSISSPSHNSEIRLLEGNGFIVLAIGGCAWTAKEPFRTTKFKVEKNGQIMEGYIAKEGALFNPRKVIYFF